MKTALHPSRLPPASAMRMETESPEQRGAPGPRADDCEVFRDLARYANVVFYRMALPEGRYEYVSPGCTVLTGFSPEEFYENPLLIQGLIHPDSRAYFAEAWTRLLAGEMRSSYEYAIIDRNGHERWLRQQNALVRDGEGRPAAIVGAVSEFTAHKRHQAELERQARAREAELESANARLRAETGAHQKALAELRDAARQLRLLTDNLPAAISYVDADERYRFNNKTYEEWFGHTRAEVTGKTVREVVGQAAYAVIEEKIKTALAGRAITFETSVPYLHGGTRYVRAACIPYWDDAHCGVVGFFVLVSDITDTKRVDTAERRHLQELAHAARLASLGEVASEMSHELVQPLSAINNYSYACSALLAEGRVDEAKDAAAKLGVQARLAQDIAQGFRRFARQGVPEKRRLDPIELTRSAMKLVQWDADARGVPLKLEAPASALPVYADCTLIEQVILNLLRNALDATGPSAWDRPITVTVRALADGVEFSVKDCGSGLTPSAKQHLFEPFFTTKADGVGIGLVVCRRIVESHDGRLWAEDNPEGRGAVFRFRLPFA